MKHIFFIACCLSCILGNTQQAILDNAPWYSVERFSESSGLPKYILFSKGIVNKDNFLQKLKEITVLKNFDFEIISVEHDPQGNNHYRYQQVSGNLPVVGGMLIAHERNGSIYACNGEVFETPKQFTLKYNDQEALQFVLSINKNTKYFYEIKGADELLKQVTHDANASYSPTPKLVYLPAKMNEVTHQSSLAYAIDLFAAEPLWRKVFYVDANTLEILYIEDKIETTNVPGKAKTKYSGVQDIISDSAQPGVFHLYESVRGNGSGMQTLNMQKGTVYSTSKDFNDSDNYWNNVNSNMDEVAGDVHWGAEKTYDFYKNIFNRNSIDNNGLRLTSYVHYSTNYINAFWNGYFMTYGDGGSGYLPLTSLDVCGHEITHGLTQKTAALVYSNESGALNESFSDIFGVSIDFYTSPATANFRIGEQFGPGGAGLRDMQEPKIYQNPGTYKGQYWVANKSDNGGVHYNSGPQNKWYYLLSKGDTGTNDNGLKYKVDSIGFMKAAQITFKSLTTFLTPLSEYQDARFYSILAAQQLFGDCSNEVKQVINAWNAVGVGNGFDTVVHAGFMALTTQSCNVPFTVQFRNNSINAVGYIWDFGDGQTSLQTNPIHTYTNFGNYTVKLFASACNNAKIDSLIYTQYIKTDPNLPDCQKVTMPQNGVGVVLNTCNGTLRDDGDTANYGNLVYSVRSIVPNNTAALKLTFKQFDFEYGFDFLYVYDGPDTLSKLIGKYTGNNLPNNGIIICKSGAATFRETSDYLISGKGFEVDWQCITKTNIDYKLIFPQSQLLGRKFTSGDFGNAYTINLDIIQSGLQLNPNTTLKFRVNGGSINSRNVSTPLLSNNYTIGPFDFSSPGTYLLEAWIEDPLDGVKENDTLKINLQEVDNAPINLPLIENFDAMNDVWLYEKTYGVGGNNRLDYDNTSPQGRLRSYAGADIVYGTHSITLDKSDRNWLFDTVAQSNFITLTYNMSNVAKLASPLLFRFQYNQHGDKQYNNDYAWVRGCDTNSWIKFYDLFANKGAPGILKVSPVFNLNYFLDSAKQILTSSFQIRFGQQDQSNVINIQQYTGYTFDNLRFSTWNSGITNKQNSTGLSIYPNPTEDFTLVHSLKKLTKAVVMDMSGKIITQLELPGTEFFELDFTGMKKGIYLISFIDDEGGKLVSKIIIK